MQVHTQAVIVPTLDGDPMRGHLAWPADTIPVRTAVVLGELFGLTDVQRGAAERVAAMGFLAIAPDLLHRHSPDGPLQEDDAGRQRGLELAGRLSRLELLSDVRDALDFLSERSEADVQSHQVSVGMSYGGHVAFLAAARLGLSACAVMYAGWLGGTEIAASRPQPTGALAPDLAAAGTRVLVLAGELDTLAPPGELEAVRSWAADAGAHLEIVVEPDVGHRFASPGRPGYDPTAAEDAWRRVERHLSRPCGQQRVQPGGRDRGLD